MVMKKVLCAVFCIAVCVAVIGMLPQSAESRPFVDQTFCMNAQCHVLSTLQAQHQGDCTICHAEPEPQVVYADVCAQCHPITNASRCNLIRLHDEVPPEPPVTVNGLYCIDCHLNCQQALACEVAISPASATLDAGAKQTFTASTTCGGQARAGDYTWEVSGGTADSTTGESIEYTAGNVPGNFTVTVTDRVNGSATASAAVAIATELCSIDVVQDQVARSRWVPLPAIITVSGSNTDFKQFGTRVEFEGDGSATSVIGLGALVIPSAQTIQQLVLILPSVLTGSDSESETITVSVTNGGCDTALDTFDLQLLPFGLDK
jgi:hypothetical protein